MFAAILDGLVCDTPIGKMAAIQQCVTNRIRKLKFVPRRRSSHSRIKFNYEF